MYIIHKTTRIPVSISYHGATWDRAGIRHEYQEVYSNKAQAERLAKILTKYNPVGFIVSDAH